MLYPPRSPRGPQEVQRKREAGSHLRVSAGLLYRNPALTCVGFPRANTWPVGNQQRREAGVQLRVSAGLLYRNPALDLRPRRIALPTIHELTSDTYHEHPKSGFPIGFFIATEAYKPRPSMSWPRTHVMSTQNRVFQSGFSLQPKLINPDHP